MDVAVPGVSVGHVDVGIFMRGSSRFHRPIVIFDGCRGFRRLCSVISIVSAFSWVVAVGFTALSFIRWMSRFQASLFGHFGRLLGLAPVPVSGDTGRRLGVVLLLARQVAREVRSVFATPFLVILPGPVFRDWSFVLDG